MSFRTQVLGWATQCLVGRGLPGLLGAGGVATAPPTAFWENSLEGVVVAEEKDEIVDWRIF